MSCATALISRPQSLATRWDRGTEQTRRVDQYVSLQDLNIRG